MEWKEINNELCRSFEFKDFKQAFAFMTRVASIAEEQQHHPWWSNVWNKVEIKLCTHDAANTITDKDRDLAQSIDAILQDYS